MKFKLFTVFDTKVLSFSPPLSFSHKGDALRWFQERAIDTANNIGKYPTDFILFEIGEYDNVDGSIQTYPHINCGIAIEFVKPN